MAGPGKGAAIAVVVVVILIAAGVAAVLLPARAATTTLTSALAGQSSSSSTTTQSTSTTASTTAASGASTSLSSSTAPPPTTTIIGASSSTLASTTVPGGSTTLLSSSSTTTPTSTTTVYACGQTIPGCFTTPPESDCPDSCPLTLTNLQGCPTGSSYQCGASESSSTTTEGSTSLSTTLRSTTSSVTVSSTSTTTTIMYDSASANNTQSSITVSVSGADRRVFCAGVNPGGISSVSWSAYKTATDLSIGNTTGSNACGMGGFNGGQVLGALGTRTLDQITLVNSTACNSCSTMGDGWVAQNTHETVFILYAGVWASNSLSWGIAAPSYCTKQFDTPVGVGTTGSQGFVALYACQPPIPLSGATSVSIPSVIGTDSIAISAVVVN